MRLIDADALESEVLYEEDYDYDYDENPIENYQPVEAVRLSEIKNAPTVNAEPVVRCGECERRVKSADLTDSVLCRWLHNLQMPKSGYCCYGERRSE